MLSKSFGVGVCVALSALIWTGCNKEQPAIKPAGGSSQTGGGQKPAYHPEHGLDNGHLFDIDTETFKAQWHQSSKHNKIEIKFLDAEGKAYKPAKVDGVSIRSTSRTDGMEWTMEAGERNENGEVASFSLDNEELHQAMTLGIRVEFKCGDEVFSAVVPPHEPHMHD